MHIQACAPPFLCLHRAIRVARPGRLHRRRQRRSHRQRRFSHGQQRRPPRNRRCCGPSKACSCPGPRCSCRTAPPSSRNVTAANSNRSRTGRQRRLAASPELFPAEKAASWGWRCHPSFDSDKSLFAYFTAGADNRIARLTLTEAERRGRVEAWTAGDHLRRHPQGLHPQRRPNPLWTGRKSVCGNR